MQTMFSAVLTTMTFDPNAPTPDTVLKRNRAFERRDGKRDDAADEHRRHRGSGVERPVRMSGAMTVAARGRIERVGGDNRDGRAGKPRSPANRQRQSSQTPRTPMSVSSSREGEQ